MRFDYPHDRFMGMALKKCNSINRISNIFIKYKGIIYPTESFSKALNYSRTHEEITLKELGRVLNKDIPKCGLFVDEKLDYIAPTPVGFIDEDVIRIRKPTF